MTDEHGHRGPGRALAIALALTLTFAAVEVVAGLLSGSLALISDAAHMLVDSAGLVLALAATLIARRPADLARSYGYVRAEVLVVPLHVLFMLGISGYIVFEAIGRIGATPEIAAVPVLVTGAAGLLLNVVVLRMLHGHGRENLNARSAALEVLADALGSIGVLVAAAVLLVWGWTPIDVIVSFLIAALVVPRAFMLLRQSVGILLESTPAHVRTRDIERDALAIPGITALHDLHVWSLAPRFVALSAHVEVERMDGVEHQISALSSMLRERHGIAHVTLQPETHELHEAIECCDYPDVMEDLTRLHSPPAGEEPAAPRR